MLSEIGGVQHFPKAFSVPYHQAHVYTRGFLAMIISLFYHIQSNLLLAVWTVYGLQQRSSNNATWEISSTTIQPLWGDEETG